VVLITIGCTGVFAGALSYAHRPSPVETVLVAAVVQGDLKTAVTATGSFQPRRSVDVKFDGQNFVEHLYVDEGSHVTKGEVLAQMDTRLLTHNRAQAQQLLEKDDASLALASAALKREQALWDAQVVARAELETIQANYEAALHQREADHQALLEIDEQIDRSNLRSPIDGIVSQLFVREGEMLGSAAAVASIGSSSATSKPTNTVMTLAQNGGLQLFADVNEADFAAIHAGQDVEMMTDAFRPRVFHGHVTSIGLQPTLNNGITTYRVVVDVADPDTRLRIGMPVNAMFLKTLRRNTLLVPATAISTRGDQGFIGVVDTVPDQHQINGQVQARCRIVNVMVLERTASAAALKGPVHNGDLVVISPQGLVDSNEKGRLVDVQKVRFQLNPTFSDLEFAGRKQIQGSQSVLQPPKPKNMLQQMLGL
jgi:RND family efflux transporter MFP subunit